MGYSHQNSKGKTYFLHSKDVVLKGGRNQTIYYFAKRLKPVLVIYQRVKLLLKTLRLDFLSSKVSSRVLNNLKKPSY